MRSPKEKTQTISFRIPVSLKKRLEEDSDRDQRSLSQQVVFLLKEAIGDTPALKIQKYNGPQKSDTKT